MNVVGLDLSMTHTGVAGLGWTETIRPGKLRGHPRIQYLRDAVGDYTRTAGLVVMEGLAYDGHDRMRQNAGFSWMVRHDLWRRGVPYATVPPSNLKKYGAGSGISTKEQVRSQLAAQLKWVSEQTSLDETDAATLVLMGLDWAGEPVLVVPDKPNREALLGCAWPAPGAAAA